MSFGSLGTSASGSMDQDELVGVQEGPEEVLQVRQGVGVRLQIPHGSVPLGGGREAAERGQVELAKFITDPESELLPRAMVNRTWAHFLGRGFVNPVDDIGPHNQPVLPEVFDKLTEEFREGGCDVKQLVRWITSSAAYQASSLRPGKSRPEDDLFSVMALRPMSPEQLFDSLLTATAAHRAGSGRDDAKREAWMRQFLFAFGNDEGDEATSFQGTIPQSLMMMNGDLMRDALSGKPGSFLAD
ncbi:hypothetical protein HK102_010211, partial [Quaeritorhiza haematococci]